MSAEIQVGKLEALLARIKTRAEAPRAEAPRLDAQAFVPAVAGPEPEPVLAQAPSVRPEPPPLVESAPPEAYIPPSRALSEPPISELPPPTQADLEPEMEVVDVEVSSEIVEVDIDEDDPLLADAGFPRESGALPIAESRAVEEAAQLEEISEDLVESLPPSDPAEPVEPPGNEVIEPAPSSSPRPIESTPPPARHTPPPESGKQVAAAASVKPPATLSSSPPPPSSEGHTLMGGWREPGVPAAPGRAGPAGVRVPPPPPPPPPPELTASAPPAPMTGSSTPSLAAPPLAAASVTPAFADFAEVGRFEGTTPTFAPATFGDLLDASLSL